MIYTTDLIQAKFEMFSIDGELMSVYGSKTIAEYVRYRSIEAFKCYCGSLLTPSFRRSTASSGRTIKYLRYGFKRRRCHYKLA